MNDFPRTCQVGLYSSSMSTCHLSGSRYFITSSTVPSPPTASDSSSMPCCDGGGTAAESASAGCWITKKKNKSKAKHCRVKKAKTDELFKTLLRFETC